MAGFSFLSPLFLLGALAVGVPILLHLLRRRTDEVVDFPAVRLLQQVPLVERRRRRLRELLLLALRIGALLLLALAFARPYVVGADASLSSPVTVVAVDTSFSLSAPGQFEAAREQAGRALDATPSDHAVALVTFAESATVAAPAGSDRERIRALIRALAPGPHRSRYPPLFALAADLIGSRQGTVAVVTDLQQSSWDAIDRQPLRDDISVQVLDVRPPAGNLAITGLERRESSVAVVAHNFGSLPAATTARLLVDGREVDTQALRLDAQASGTLRFTKLPERGGAEVRLDDPAGYPADNARFLLLDPPPRLPVAVVTTGGAGTGGLYVERALDSPLEPLFEVSLHDGLALAAWEPVRWRGQAALIVTATRSMDRIARQAVREYLHQGGAVWLALGPDVDEGTLADVVGVDLGLTSAADRAPSRATLVASDTRHPIFRPFVAGSGDVATFTASRIGAVRVATDHAVLARFSGGSPALIEIGVGSGRLLVFTSDLGNRWNRFPLEPSFVPFALEVVRYLTAGREQPRDFTLADVPAGFAATPGFATRQESGTTPEQPAPVRVAVNVDVRESNPARMSVEQFQAAIPRTRASAASASTAPVEARAQEQQQRLWQVGIALMLMALVAEGLLGRKAV